MKHNSSNVDIIANITKNTTKNKEKGKKSPKIYTYSKEIKELLGVETSELSIDEHIKAISIIKKEKKEEFLNSKMLYPLGDASKEPLLLKDVAEQTFKRDASFFYNKIQTLYDVTNYYNYKQSFITLTSLKSRDDGKSLDDIAHRNHEIKEDFNNFFRALMKQRIFKETLNTSNRIYLRANEFTKRYFLHHHFLMLLDGENYMGFLDAFITTYISNAKALNLGRTELVIPYDIYQRLKGLETVKEITHTDEKTKKKEKVLILNKETLDLSELNLTLNYLYIKKLKKPRSERHQEQTALEANMDAMADDSDDSVIKYALKYVYKNFKDKLDNAKNGGIAFVSNEDVLYSLSNIRRINMSRFSFPKYLYFGLKDEKGENLYNKMTLKELSILHIEKKIKVVLKKNMDFKTVKKTIEHGIIHDRDKYDLDIDMNLDIWIQATGTEKEKEADRLATEFYEIKKYLKMLDKCREFEDLEEFLSDEFGIEYNFSNSEHIKYTLIAENETLSNQFLKYIIINGEKYYMDYSRKYILMDCQDDG